MTDDVTAGRPPVVGMHVCVPDTAGQCTLPSHYAYGSAVDPYEALKAEVPAEVLEEWCRALYDAEAGADGGSYYETRAGVAALYPLIAAAERARIADAILNSCDHSGSFQPAGTDEVWACDECRDAASIARDYTPTDSGDDTSGGG